MRIALRAPMVGCGPDAAGARTLYRALARAGAHVVLEACDPGHPASAADAPPAPDTQGPVNAHLQWCSADAVDAQVEAPVRVARVRLPQDLEPAAVAALAAMDQVWVGGDADRSRLLGLGLEPGRVWTCPEPVELRGVAPAPPPGAHGRITLAIEPDPARLLNTVCVWAEMMPAEADVTLVLAADAGLPDRVVAVLARAGRRDVEIADLMLICDPLTDRERLGLVAAADLVLTASPRIAAEAAALGVHAADLAMDPPLLAAALHRAPGAETGELRDVRHDADAVAATVIERMGDLARGRGRGAYAGRPRVVLEGSMFGAHSLAAVNRGLARAMLRQGRVDLALHNSEGALLDPRAPVDASIRSLVWGCVREHDGPPQVTIRHGHPADLSPVRDGALVAVLPWEFGGAPAAWLEAADRAVDEIWVPTAYVRDGYVAAGADPRRVAVVPNGVDPEVFHPRVAPMDLGDAAPGYRFLFVGGLAWRKGVDLLVRAYAQAFGPDDDVSLVLKDFGPGGPYPADGVERLVDELAADPAAARVVRLTGALPEGLLPGLYAACDCLVHPYRGEAYGMTMAEAMATGLPVIAPDRGAAMAFMDDQTALLVESRRVELEVAQIAGQRPLMPPVVHEADLDALARAMRWAYEHREQASVVGRRASGLITARHTWDAAARIAAGRIAALAGAGAAAERIAA